MCIRDKAEAGEQKKRVEEGFPRNRRNSNTSVRVGPTKGQDTSLSPSAEWSRKCAELPHAGHRDKGRSNPFLQTVPRWSSIRPQSGTRRYLWASGRTAPPAQFGVTFPIAFGLIRCIDHFYLGPRVQDLSHSFNLLLSPSVCLRPSLTMEGVTPYRPTFPSPSSLAFLLLLFFLCVFCSSPSFYFVHTITQLSLRGCVICVSDTAPLFRGDRADWP